MSEFVKLPNNQDGVEAAETSNGEEPRKRQERIAPTTGGVAAPSEVSVKLSPITDAEWAEVGSPDLPAGYDPGVRWDERSLD